MIIRPTVSELKKENSFINSILDFECPDCKKIFSNRGMLKTHYYYKHIPKGYKKASCINDKMEMKRSVDGKSHFCLKCHLNVTNDGILIMHDGLGNSKIIGYQGKSKLDLTILEGISWNNQFSILRNFLGLKKGSPNNTTGIVSD